MNWSRRCPRGPKSFQRSWTHRTGLFPNSSESPKKLQMINSWLGVFQALSCLKADQLSWSPFFLELLKIFSVPVLFSAWLCAYIYNLDNGEMCPMTDCFIRCLDDNSLSTFNLQQSCNKSLNRVQPNQSTSTTQGLSQPRLLSHSGSETISCLVIQC